MIEQIKAMSIQERGMMSMKKRRTFKPDFKVQVVLEELTGAKSRAEICREHNLGPQLLGRWRAEFLQGAAQIFATEQKQVAEEARIAELERMVGRLTMELEVAKKASSVWASLSSRNGR